VAIRPRPKSGVRPVYNPGAPFHARAHGMSFYDRLKWTADGLIPAIIQEQSTGRILMMPG